MTLLEYTLSPDIDIIICESKGATGGSINLTLPKINKICKIIISNRTCQNESVRVYVPHGDGSLFDNGRVIDGTHTFVSYYDIEKNKFMWHDI